MVRSVMTSKLGQKLRDLRKQRSLSLDAFAQQAKISKSYLWELENRDAPNPTADKIAAIASVFGLPSTYFVDDSVDAPQESHLDQVFFREYVKLGPDSKQQLHKIMKTFLDSDDKQ